MTSIRTGNSPDNYQWLYCSQFAIFLRPAYGVVIVPAPDLGIGAELVPIAVVLEDFFFLCGALYVLESAPPLLLDSGVDRVHCVCLLR